MLLFILSFIYKMNIYYTVARKANYIFPGVTLTSKSISDIQREIKKTTDFCREEESITIEELRDYVGTGITFFTENDEHKITGLINFDVNQPTITIHGLCSPPSSMGIGSLLIEKIKEFAQANSFTKIKLTCYDSVVSFYRKKGFTVVGSPTTIYDSDEDSDDEGKTRYNMELNLSGASTSSTARGIKKNKKVKKTKKHGKSKKRATKKSKKTRKYLKKH
jgi:GNAT superfamily N-acetyltransferase